MIVRVLRVGSVAAVLAVAGCSAVDDGGRDWNPDHQPGYVAPGREGATPVPTWPGSGSGLGLPGVGQGEPSQPDHEVRGGSGYAASPAVFQLINGSDVVRVSVGDLGGDLFSVSTPAESRVVPAVSVDGNTVVAGLRDSGVGGPAIVNVVLATDVRWQVRLSGGASDEAVDLTGGAGGDVELTAGTSRAEVFLPAASGTQSVTMSGGAGRLLVHLGGNAPVRVAARNGAADVTIDGQTRNGVPGGSVFTPAGWDTAKDRFDVDATAGVSDLSVGRS
ncbi:hypothetical protein GCM10010434_042100 [Winogradskya humida]